MDSNLEYINDDVAQILLKYLQNHWSALMSLGLSCKQWNSRVNLFVTQRLNYHAPNTLVQSVAHRNKIYREILSMKQHFSDIRLFEATVTEKYNMVGLYTVPWDKSIAILTHEHLFLVLNINDGSVIHREDGCTFFDLSLRLFTTVSFSNHPNPMENQALLRVFSIRDKTVTLIDTNITEYYHGDNLKQIQLTDDGTIWRGKKPAYSITSLTIDITLPKQCDIITIRSISPSELFIYYMIKEEYDDYFTVSEEIMCYSTATRQSWLYFRHPRLIADDASLPRITFHSDCELIKVGGYDSALMQIVNSKLKFITTAEKLYDVELSPDRTMFFYAEYSRLTIYAIESGAEEYIQTLDWQEEQLIDYSWLRNDKNICKVIREYKIVMKEESLGERFIPNTSVYNFHWMTNDTILGVSHGRKLVSIVNLHSPVTDVRGLDLPSELVGQEFHGGVSRYQIVDERTVLLHTAKEGASVILKLVL